MMLRAYGEAIACASPDISEPLLVAALSRILDIGGGDSGATLADYDHPADGKAFAVSPDVQQRQIARLQS